MKAKLTRIETLSLPSLLHFRHHQQKVSNARHNDLKSASADALHLLEMRDERHA